MRVGELAQLFLNGSQWARSHESEIQLRQPAWPSPAASQRQSQQSSAVARNTPIRRSPYFRIATASHVRMRTCKLREELIDSLAEWSKAVDSSSTIFGCVGSNPTAVISTRAHVNSISIQYASAFTSRMRISVVI